MAAGGVKETDILSDETFDLLCSVCKKKNKNTEAAKFCVDCRDYYCSICVKFHDDVPALSLHKILDKGQFQPGPGQVLQMVPTERCDKHSHKHVDMYCQNHDDVGCSTCMAVDHKLTPQRTCKHDFGTQSLVEDIIRLVEHTPVYFKINRFGTCIGYKKCLSESQTFELNLLGHLEETDTRKQSKNECYNDSKTQQSTQYSSKKQAASTTQKAEESATRLKSYDGYNNESQKYQSTQSSSKKQAASTTQKAEESATNDSQKYQSTQSSICKLLVLHKSRRECYQVEVL
ncbi:uncharacterized protein LOC128549319 [Mercenaria mercenaria]|uniref:uncharacterized protein LOC128549319 n=1 Tax=Mercenaria mercenaria TaxID=6596 RepID=UPI00234F81A4|nr:uncharacterized protein LOC128549319 [Mercenaria mercenaria]